MRAALLALALTLCAAPAHAQFADTWLRMSLVPARPFAKKARSAAVYPEQQIPLRFSHRQHVEADVKCESCHDAVDRSARTLDRNVPVHVQCEECHDLEAARRGEPTDPLSTCEACHPGYDAKAEPAKAVFPAANLVFSHELHLQRGAKCADCHAGVAEAELATREHLPKMATCLSCHDGREAPNRCRTCHLAEPDGVLRTRFASGTLAPSGTLRDDDHGRNFLERHARIAREELDTCESCHRRAECEACHASSSKAFRLHPPDWAQTHAVSARGQELDCASCHRQQDFCVTCHQQTGAARESRLRQPGTPLFAQRFHPAGWADLVRTGPDHHSFHAQANLQSCASCHEEQTCLQCHSQGGALVPGGVSPHPPGWSDDAGACRAFARAPVACAKCHGGGAGLAGLRARLGGCR